MSTAAQPDRPIPITSADALEVYLIPIGLEGYELYCEVPDETAIEEEAPAGFFRSLVHRVKLLLATAEMERRQGVEATDEAGKERGWVRRMRDRGLRWVAEAMAEQRLLWHLRRQQSATLIYPADVGPDRAATLVRTKLRDDGDKHRLWLIIDGLGLIGSALLALIPGPNVLAYYFAFRVVGHYLSYRGARQGLDRVEWRRRPSALLAELRAVMDLPPVQRRQRVDDIAARLKLEHLASFFERTALPTA
jgi:hypothetical protein